jgi:hypothetical protein
MEHVKALREVMPAILFTNKPNLQSLLTDLGVTTKDCGERPQSPNAAVDFASCAEESGNDQLANDDSRANNDEGDNLGPMTLQLAEL